MIEREGRASDATRRCSVLILRNARVPEPPQWYKYRGATVVTNLEITMARMTEQQVGIAVLRILAGQPDGEASFETLTAELPKQLTLSADDSVGSVTQLLRDMKSQARPTAGNIFHDGYVITATRGDWRITPNGRKHIAGAA